MGSSVKEQLGCWFYERWRTELAIYMLAITFGRSRQWLSLCNRGEKIKFDRKAGGVTCCWNNSSKLTVSRVFPGTSARLLSCLFSKQNHNLQTESGQNASEGKISVILPIGGIDRIRIFQAVVKSLLESKGVHFEIIVVEQASEPTVGSLMPKTVKVIHCPCTKEEKFNKSRLLNIGVENASGDLIAIHDGDYLVRDDYLRSCVVGLSQYDVIRPGRFIFYLDQSATEDFLKSNDLRKSVEKVGSVESMVQNNPTPIVIRKDAYWKIGGHDESFVGWGGEDVEFLSRCRSLCSSDAGFAPIVHLWHPPAQQKESGHRNHQQQIDKLAIPIDRRIEQLVDFAQATYLGNNVKP